MLYSIGLTLFFVMLNGFFVAAEFAIVKVRLSQIELRIREGSGLARLAKHLVSHLDEYLSATQLGITLASLGLGWIGESVVSKMIVDITFAAGLDVTPETAHKLALPTAFVIITILHIVFGELAPKSMAIQRSEQITMLVAVPLRLFYIMFKPFIWILNSFANFMIRRVGFEAVTEESELHSPAELRFLITESTKRGLIDKGEHKMIENIFEFSETPVKQIMIPRTKIVGIEKNIELDDLINVIVEDGFSRLPVYDTAIDNIVGVVYVKDLIQNIRNGNEFDLSSIIRTPFFINEDEMINSLLRKMQSNRIHLAVVMNEFGVTAGIVTLEDIIEEIVGEIQDEYDEEAQIIEQKSESEFFILAIAPIDDVNDILPIPLPEDDEYETVGGLILHETGRIPDIYETIDLENYKCKILQRSSKNVEKILLSLKIESTETE